MTVCATVNAQYNVIEASEDDRERELEMYRLLYSGSDAKLDKVLAELGSLKNEVSNLQKQLNSQSKNKECRGTHIIYFRFSYIDAYIPCSITVFPLISTPGAY